METVLTPALCRAARAYLQWTQADLARSAGVSLQTVTRYEGDTDCLRAMVAAMQRAFEREGFGFENVNPDFAMYVKETVK